MSLTREPAPCAIELPRFLPRPHRLLVLKLASENFQPVGRRVAISEI